MKKKHHPCSSLELRTRIEMRYNNHPLWPIVIVVVFCRLILTSTHEANNDKDDFCVY